jgi:hypothetical protein
MIVDTSTSTSAPAAFVEILCFALYGYIDSFLKTVGIRRFSVAATESTSGNVDSRNKSKHIENCLETIDSVDLWELRELALSEGGLLQGVFCALNVFDNSKRREFDFRFRTM